MKVARFKLEGLLNVIKELDSRPGLGLKNVQQLVHLLETIRGELGNYRKEKNETMKDARTVDKKTGQVKFTGSNEQMKELEDLANEEVEFDYGKKITITVPVDSPLISVTTILTFTDVLGKDNFEFIENPSAWFAPTPAQCQGWSCAPKFAPTAQKPDGTFEGDVARKKEPSA